MASSSKETLIGLTFYQQDYQELQESLDGLQMALRYLQFEGRTQLPQNLSTFQKCLRLLKTKFRDHSSLNRKTVFPFVGTHVPRLELLLKFLDAESRQCQSVIRQAEVSLREIRNCRNQFRKVRIINQLREKVIYLICFCRTYLQLESEKMTSVLDREFREPERQSFYKQIGRHARMGFYIVAIGLCSLVGADYFLLGEV